METVDVLIHVHPELPADARAKIEQEVRDCGGVISAHFNQHKHPHALIVLYNPDVVQSKQMLEVVKRHDPAASIVGL